MPDNKATQEPLDPDTDDRDAEVDEPDGPDEDADEQDELDEEDDDDTPGDAGVDDDEPEAPVEDARYAQINAQIAQLTQAVQGLAQMSQRRPGAPPAANAPSKDFDEMTGRELAAHFNKHSSNQMNTMVQQMASVLQRQQEAMFLLADRNNDPRVVQQALAMAYKQGNLPLGEAYKIAQGMFAKGQLEKTQKKLSSYQKQSRKRSRKAKLGSTRPTNAPTQHRPAVSDVRSAMAAATKDLAAQGINIAD